MKHLKWSLLILLIGIMVTGYGGLCQSPTNDSGSSIPSNWPRISDPDPDYSGYDGKPYAIAVDTDYLYIAGSSVLSWTDEQWWIEKRLKTTGALDTNFDTDGVIVVNPTTTNREHATDIVVDDTYLYIIGNDVSAGPNDSQWRIDKRNKTTGALITGFGSNGVVLSNPSATGDYPEKFVVDANYLYIAGYTDSTGSSADDVKWRIEKRDKTTGALITAFDSDGVVVSNPSIRPDIPFDIVIDDYYLYIVGADASISGGDSQWRIEKRDKTTGALVTAFDSDGIVQSNPSSSTDVDAARAIGIDNSYIYVLGNYWDSMLSTGWRIEIRSKTTGALEGIGGINPEGDDQPYDIAIDSSYLYVIGNESVYDPWWRIEKRYADPSSPGLNLGFGSDGVVRNKVGGSPSAIATDVNYLYIVGSANSKWRIEKRLKTTGAMVQ